MPYHQKSQSNTVTKSTFATLSYTLCIFSSLVCPILALALGTGLKDTALVFTWTFYDLHTCTMYNGVFIALYTCLIVHQWSTSVWGGEAPL
mgnify:CR=1 FL=1